MHFCIFLLLILGKKGMAPLSQREAIFKFNLVRYLRQTPGVGEVHEGTQSDVPLRGQRIYVRHLRQGKFNPSIQLNINRVNSIP